MYDDTNNLICKFKGDVVGSDAHISSNSSVVENKMNRKIYVLLISIVLAIFAISASLYLVIKLEVLKEDVQVLFPALYFSLILTNLNDFSYCMNLF